MNETLKVAPKAIPTRMDLFIERYEVRTGKNYYRETLIFGDREPIRFVIKLTNWFNLPVINAPIKIYLDGRYIATVTTNLIGYAEYYFMSGIPPPGTHTLRAVWEGDFWNAPTEATKTIKTIGMEESIFKIYVESLNIPVTEVEAKLVDQCLTEDIGVVPIRAEVDMQRNRYILTMLVPVESTQTPSTAPTGITAIIALIVAIALVLFAASLQIYLIAVYVRGIYQCGICGQQFLTCEALREHLITQHPNEWEKIKENFECAPPPTPDWLKWMLYFGVGAASVVLAIEVIRAMRSK